MTELTSAIIDAVGGDPTARAQLGAISAVASDLALGPASLIRRAPVAAQVAQAGAAVADTARAAVELAISQVPADTRLLLEAVTISVLRGVAADTPIGRLAYLAEPLREGVWQLRAGDYSAQIAADTFGFRFLKVTAIAATSRAWVRVVPDGVFQAAWTGLTADMVDAVEHLKAAARLLDPYCDLVVPPFEMKVNGNNDPRIPLLVPGTRFRGHGDKSWIRFTGTASAFAMVQPATDDVTVSDMRISCINPNVSAGNPACIMISPNGQYSTLTDMKNTKVKNVLLDRTSLGIVAFAHFINGQEGFKRPTGVKISELRCTTNGVPVSMFGAANFDIGEYDLTYDSVGADPNSKQTAFRVLGSDTGEIRPGTSHGFPVGVFFDAAFFGARAVNRNMTVHPIKMYDAHEGVTIIECDGYCRISAPFMHRSATTTDTTFAVRILAATDLSTVPTNDPLRRSVVGDVTLTDLDAEGYSVAIYEDGAMGNLIINGGRYVGNKNTSELNGARGAVIIQATASGIPKSITITEPDFLMSLPQSLPSMILKATGPITVLRAKLPERPNQEGSIVALRGSVIYTDEAEQRPYNNVVNNGSNTVHKIGDFANYIDGTALPAPTFTAAPWTRNPVNVTETPTGTFTKSGGVDGVFDAAFYSTERYVGDFELVYRLKQKTPQMVVGLASEYRGASFAAPDHCAFYTADSSIYTARGAQLRNTQDYDTTTIERWARRGTRLTMIRNNVVMVDISVSAELALGLQACLRSVGDAVEILRFAAL